MDPVPITQKKQNKYRQTGERKAEFRWKVADIIYEAPSETREKISKLLTSKIIQKIVLSLCRVAFRNRGQRMVDYGLVTSERQYNTGHTDTDANIETDMEISIILALDVLLCLDFIGSAGITLVWHKKSPPSTRTESNWVKVKTSTVVASFGCNFSSNDKFNVNSACWVKITQLWVLISILHCWVKSTQRSK